MIWFKPTHIETLQNQNVNCPSKKISLFHEVLCKTFPVYYLAIKLQNYTHTRTHKTYKNKAVPIILLEALQARANLVVLE